MVLDPGSFETYRHGRLGLHVSRCVPSPKRICAHSWSSVSVSLWDEQGLFPLVGDDALRLFRYQRLLVLAIRQAVRRRATVAGWNGIRQRIFVRVYRGRGSKRDQARFLAVERLVRQLCALSFAKLRASIKKPKLP